MAFDYANELARRAIEGQDKHGARLVRQVKRSTKELNKQIEDVKYFKDHYKEIGV